ncbi:hypothetical protein Q4Q35_10770 [Flavivirga aquimarina]|uniref:Spo0E like sporulation regulatory protein n=1 Tax=Flavivirga aquimarina TaxID=2027862 RepID=A0ABT8WAW2_9FLAO|nr:hypothetical protein [Flavivirga aquimarina]MDO5970288.1 hypothetical protein [Flavivirga aquimarina]
MEEINLIREKIRLIVKNLWDLEKGLYDPNYYEKSKVLSKKLNILIHKEKMMMM